MNKKYFVVLLALCLSTAAHAKKFQCEGTDGTRGHVVLDCDQKLCSISGELSNTDLVPSTPNLEDCDATRRAESSARMYANIAYFDVKGDHCWADYIRVSKSLLKGGSGYASLVKTSGGDTHDSSGYQYASLKCE